MTDERLDQILKQALAPEIADTEIAVKQAFLKLQIKQKDPYKFLRILLYTDFANQEEDETWNRI